MVEIKEKKLNLSQRNIILSIVLLVVIISLIIGVILSNNSKGVVSQNVENTQEEVIANEEEIIEYMDISQLEQNIVVEEENEIQNKDEEKDKKVTEGMPYYIKVNYGAQVVTIYKKDEEGNYTLPVKAMVCSTGVATPTSGVYKIPYKYRWLGLQGGVYGQYCTQIVGNILFHSVPYLERGNPGSLEYWEYDKLGTYASAGCIRLTVSDAIWIYNNCGKGTQVEFYSSSNPGPLGKPSAKKISNANGDLKNWDPTDPDSNNPWKNYKPEENKNTNTETNNNQTNNNQTNNNQTNDNKTNTQVNENNNKVNEDTDRNKEVNENTNSNINNNEVVNEIYTNTVQTNEILKNNITVNETKLDNKEYINENM